MLLTEITQDMIDTALVLPARGLVWVPANGQIVYRKFDTSYILNKQRDAAGLEIDMYWVGAEQMTLNDLFTNCVWLPTPYEIRDLAAAKFMAFLNLAETQRTPVVWRCEYSPGFIGKGTTPWEAEFYILDKYIVGNCDA